MARLNLGQKTTNYLLLEKTAEYKFHLITNSRKLQSPSYIMRCRVSQLYILEKLTFPRGTGAYEFYYPEKYSKNRNTSRKESEGIISPSNLVYYSTYFLHKGFQPSTIMIGALTDRNGLIRERLQQIYTSISCVTGTYSGNRRNMTLSPRPSL